MYTILLKSDKSLIGSKKAVIYQNDNLADSLCFIIPKEFGEDKMDLTKCLVMLSYKDPGNVIHQEILTVAETDYKEDYTKYVLPVTTELTKFAGDIALSLTFVEHVFEEGTINTKMHTGEIYITISPLTNQYATTDMSSFEGLATAIANIGQRVEDVSATVPDDLIKENSHINLSVKGEATGEGVDVFDGNENIDGESDGITDLDTVYDSTETEPYREDDDGTDINYNIYNDVEWQII